MTSAVLELSQLIKEGWEDGDSTDIDLPFPDYAIEKEEVDKRSAASFQQRMANPGSMSNCHSARSVRIAKSLWRPKNAQTPRSVSASQA